MIKIIMENLNIKEVWFVTGSQHLYGPETLLQVAADSKAITEALDNSPENTCQGNLQTGAYYSRFNF